MAPTLVNKKNIIFIIENGDEEELVNDTSSFHNSNINNYENDSYYARNKDMFKERYLSNLENKRAYQIDYNLINHEKYSEYQKNYYERRREKLLESKKEKVMCECGKMVSAGHMTCHKKSSIHFKRINAMCL
jgi:hypothetical protein